MVRQVNLSADHAEYADILRQGQVELMLRRGSPPVRSKPRQYDWDVYLRREGERFREVFAAFSARGIVTRRLERMPYGLAEFEITFRVGVG